MKRFHRSSDDYHSDRDHNDGIGLNGLYDRSPRTGDYDRYAPRQRHEDGRRVKREVRWRERPQEYGSGGQPSSSHQQRGGHRHPPGLTGRQIGEYYKNLSKMKRNQQPDTSHLPTVSLGARKERQISRMLGLPDSRHDKAPTSERNCASRSEGHNPPTSWRDGATWPGRDSAVRSCDMQNQHTMQNLPEEEGKVPRDVTCNTEAPEVKHRGASVVSPPLHPVVDLTTEVADRYRHLRDTAFKRCFLQSVTGDIASSLDRALAQRGPALARDAKLDAELCKSLAHKEAHSERYRSMLEFRRKLPAYAMRQQLVDAIESNQVVVVAGETGCGKTTQVAQFILDEYIARGNGSLCHVVCTQPRRISATSVAARVAAERDETLGQESVGYQIRLERKIPRKQGSIVFCTTGVMLQWMLGNPGLVDVSHLVLDEIHERDVTTDFVITLLKQVLAKRADLKVVLMSATLNAEQFSNYFGGCPFIHIPGFTFPVQEFYLEDVLQMTGYEVPEGRAPHQKGRRWPRARPQRPPPDFEGHVLPHVRQLEAEGRYSAHVLRDLARPESEETDLELVAELLRAIAEAGRPGAVLVFLPGWDQIAKLCTLLERSAFFGSGQFHIIPLHSLMPTAMQHSIFERPPPGVRKIVVATNIAETSITIDDVVFVVDSGKTKMKNLDVERNIQTLKPEWVSLANARQRRGRAGRTQEGVCYHLYTRGREQAFASYPLPEMLRTRLEQVILQIKILQVGFAAPFLSRVMDPPDPRAVDISLKMLRTLNALDDEESLTPLGYHLARLPMEPQTGKMILMAAIFSCLDPVLTVAAGLNFKDPFVLPLGKEGEVQRKRAELSGGTKSDHLALVAAAQGWEAARRRGCDRRYCRDNFLAHGTMQLLGEMRAQLAGHLHEMGFLASPDPRARDANWNAGNVGLVRAVICAGLYPNVAMVRVKQCRNKAGARLLVRTPEDGRVQLHVRSVNERERAFESPYLVYHTKLRSTGVYLHDTTMVHPLPLLFFGGGGVARGTGVDGQALICVGEHIAFRCRPSTAAVVKTLREKLDWILENKISHPGTIDWGDGSEEATILREIIELITTEHEQDFAPAQERDGASSDSD